MVTAHNHCPVAVTVAVTSQRDVHRCFYRNILADGRAYLISRTSLRYFDAAGRITTVRPLPPAILIRPDHTTLHHTSGEVCRLSVQSACRAIGLP